MIRKIEKKKKKKNSTVKKKWQCIPSVTPLRGKRDIHHFRCSLKDLSISAILANMRSLYLSNPVLHLPEAY